MYLLGDIVKYLPDSKVGTIDAIHQRSDGSIQYTVDFGNEREVAIDEELEYIYDNELNTNL